MTATATGHIITNTVISCTQHRSGIMKKDISDQLFLRLIHVKNASQKRRCNLFINASTEKNKQSYSNIN